MALLALPAAADSDAPDPRVAVAGYAAPPSYARALADWRGAADVNAWIGAAFEYDTARALRLSETQRQAKGGLPIHPPAAFYAAPKGVCVDLARFAVETLQAIAPDTRPRYLMIEFDPVTLEGNALRRHWLAAFERDGQRWFFADSKRPGHLAGPYATTQAFIDDYARYRGRGIVAFAERAGYERATRSSSQLRSPSRSTTVMPP